MVLDTNVASALMLDEPNANIVRWLDTLPPESVWLTSITVFELRYGIERLAEGRHRRQLEDAFDRVLNFGFQNRILPLDADAAAAAASIAAMRKRTGKSGELRDTLIAGIVISSRADLATRNVRHFQDLDMRVVDPLG